jgi:hypothetical protein
MNALQKLTSWRAWLHGLSAAIIGGGANAVTLVILDPLKFNLQGEWKNLVVAVAVSSITSAALYLQKSPLPDENTTPSS